jgi:hypothetical protein
MRVSKLAAHINAIWFFVAIYGVVLIYVFARG